ncbi:LLM class flavin-dependent oxidoreductase [Streptomyces sp. ISL-10]|uniref:LLM class flavin-dependent oxidoreductase n=1 Tax=Streptomyces sp. ISL-10 TaxID=2819172 RepID=UPI001BE58D43|nr:LLM class flavin-dependent oxidoreductase [Streptomyces sp. ISL-10]MBT2364983.1 LLM class flavin-dependent oxidoreductase [Streptomyces sp. ISL-10]
MRISVCILPDRPFREAAPIWRHAEDLGFHAAYSYDHITWAGLPDSAWYGAMPTLASAAGATSRIKLGTLVSSPNYRHPVPLAHDVITLDAISEGRFVLGFGAGSPDADAVVLGQGEPGKGWSVQERGGRFRESVELLDRLLTGAAHDGRKRSTFHGRYYEAIDARLEPGCVQQPRVPFVLAANGPLGMRTVARYGASWVVTDQGDVSRDERTAAWTWSVLARRVEQLDAACEKEGRDPKSLDRTLLTGFSLLPTMQSAQAFEDVAGRCAELGFTDIVVHYPRESGFFATPRQVIEEIAPANR